MINTLHFQLLAAHTLFRRRVMRKLRNVHPELLPGQPKIIDFLLRKETAYQQEIATECLLEASTLALILNKMERLGLILREKMPDNQKNSMVRLTPRGLDIGRNLQKIFEETEQEITEGLSQEERENLSRILRKIILNGKQVRA